jgi:hypothetical protein
MESLAKLVQRVGPYVVIAIVIPGGTFVALGLYLCRQPVVRRAMSALGRTWASESLSPFTPSRREESSLLEDLAKVNRI